MTTSDTGRELLWAPSEERVGASLMTAYLDWLGRERGLRFAAYEDLWRWSVEDLDGFWRSIWDYFDVLASAPPTAVLDHRRMPGATWFPGARLNWAENVLRYADRDGPAVVGLSEDREPVELSTRSPASTGRRPSDPWATNSHPPSSSRSLGSTGRQAA